MKDRAIPEYPRLVGIIGARVGRDHGLQAQFRLDPIQQTAQSGVITLGLLGLRDAMGHTVRMKADILIKATKVDAIYSQDPNLHPDAHRYDELSYIDALNQRVGVIDSTAISLCMDNDLPILVMDLWEEHGLERAVLGEAIGTIIR